MNKLTLQKIAFWISFVIVVGSHVYMLTMGMPQDEVIPHAVINLVAGGLMLFAFMKR